MALNDDVELVKAATAHIRSAIKITKIVVTRSVKGQRGDSYAGFSAAWDTIQDDAGGMGADLVSAQDGDAPEKINAGGLTLREGRLAALMLGMQVDCAAHAQAMAGGNMSPEQYEEATRAIKHNYTRLMADLIRTGTGNGGK